MSSKQFDAPGFNSSKWEATWEVRKVKERVKAKETPAQFTKKVCPSCSKPIATDWQWRYWAGWEGYDTHYEESDYCLDEEICGK